MKKWLIDVLRKINGKKVLTPKRNRVIRAHFQNFIADLQYPPLLQQIYVSSNNTYAQWIISTAYLYNQRNNEDQMDSADEDNHDNNEKLEI